MRYYEKTFEKLKDKIDFWNGIYKNNSISFDSYILCISDLEKSLKKLKNEIIAYINENSNKKTKNKQKMTELNKECEILLNSIKK